MSARWTVLGSGSAGNASLLQTTGSGMLLDVGFSPRQLVRRLSQIGAGWEDIQAVVLSHTHSDHWHAGTLGQLLERGIPLYCHPEHVRRLQRGAECVVQMQFRKLLRTYRPGFSFEPIPGVRCLPFPVQHDGGETCGFRLEEEPTLFQSGWAIGYAADLGCWDASIVSALKNVQVLAVEFNHDVALQRASGRARWLIERVLSDRGHLSNEQGAALVRACLAASVPGRLQHLIQLHLSQDCNDRELALAAAAGSVDAAAQTVCLHTAHQQDPSPSIDLSALPAAQPPALPAEITTRRRSAS